MEITVQLPNDLDQHPEPAREALEALAVAGFRSGKLTAYQAGRLLGFTSRIEFDGFLKQRQILEQAYSAEDLENDAETLRKLEKRGLPPSQT